MTRAHVLIFLLLMPLWLCAQEETLTRKQAEELVKNLAGRMQLDFDMSQTYANAGNEIASSVMVLRLLRTSEARNDQNVEKAVSLLETKLDGYLVTFLTYPEAKKSKTFHSGLITFLNRARKYREEYPRKYPHEEIGSAIKKVFEYAQAAEQEGKAQPKGPPDR